MIEAVGIVVPARDEEDLLPACLDSLAAARRHPGLHGLRIDLLVVLDSCTDASAERVSAAGAEAMAVRVANVGAARAAGFRVLVRRQPDLPAERLLLATTDADSTVPHDWIVGLVQLADSGADLVLGTVRVADWAGHPAHLVPRYNALYSRSGPSGHPHVHGANLGIRGSTYAQVGGLPPLALAEDHALLAVCERAGAVVLRTTALPVTTSARHTGRAPGGFADLLVALSAD